MQKVLLFPEQIRFSVTLQRGQRELLIALVRKAGAAQNSYYDFAIYTVSRRKEDNEHPKRWREDFTSFLKHTISAEVLRSMRMWTTPANKKHFISAINALKRGKATGLDGLALELFIAAPPVSPKLPHPLIRIFWNVRSFAVSGRYGMIVTIPSSS